ncbi:hypothetical protein ONZ45_g15016 [Pleurotus djamor]|nr:hypothetical protein ONZ45_g15016 [Pleurotus djamor]
MQHIQRPTCVNVRIRSTQDAHKIFYAVQRGILQMVTRRLDADERLALRSGCIYAWEERGPHTEITGLGIERFTEGRRWSPSRVRDEFLFYYEKYSPTTDGNQRAKVPPRDWDPLVKQTYSVYVDTTKGRRKWHLTAYFTQATVDQLGTVDDIDGVGNLDVPDGLFKSTRVGKGRKNDEGSGRVGESSTATASATRTPPGSQSLHMYQPYPNAHYPSSYYAPSEYSPAASPHQRAPPPLSSAPSYVNESSTRLPSAAPTSHYEYNRPPTLSNRAWSPPPPISAPRNADSPFYGSAAPSPAPYSPAASYRSPPPSHSSHRPPTTTFVEAFKCVVALTLAAAELV